MFLKSSNISVGAEIVRKTPGPCETGGRIGRDRDQMPSNRARKSVTVIPG
jgi:hypothetical protein